MSSTQHLPQAEAYSPQIEEKWQEYWAKEGLDVAPRQPKRPTCYVLDMFPYPSGAGLHVGHPLGYIASDIYARYKRMKGYDVLHPMGFDAFGLPAEQYAIETGQHPAQTTAQNIDQYRKQLKRLGLSYDWSREICTSDPSYYRWTQWMFALFFESWYNKKSDRAEEISSLAKAFERGGSAAVEAFCGPNQPKFSAQAWREASEQAREAWLLNYRLAYLEKTYVNWCPALGTVLSNDEVKDGYSERGAHPVIQRRMKQWMLRLTAYADRLLRDASQLSWPPSILDMQRHWIGRSEGIEIDFPLEKGPSLKVFSTRVETIYGATFVCVSFAQALSLPLEPSKKQSIEEMAQQSQRRAEAQGISTSLYALHPLTEERIPVWAADYVLEGYGTGAVMAVPSHDARDYAFAKTYDLPLRQVIEPPLPCEGAYEGQKGKLIQSGPLDGLSVEEARVAALTLLNARTQVHKKVNYRLRDAVFARQRYWGEPLPIYYKDGLPRPLNSDQLPLLLPAVDAYLPTQAGEPPLARAQNWKNEAGHPYELSTMPGWAASSWYFFRYMDPHNSKSFCSEEALAAWKQVDLYIGGAEHAVGHLIYARCWTKFLFDRGLVGVNEFARQLVNQGMIHGRSYFVYRIKGEETYVSYGLREAQQTTALHVENDLVSEKGILNREGFRKSRSSRKNAQFILEDDQYLCGTEVEKMSKSKFNVVNPDAVIQRYGADTLRVYEMFLGPLEQSKPWDTRGMDGANRFLKKVWRLFHSKKGAFFVSEEAPNEQELRVLHQTIQKVTQDTEKLAFNTAVSAMMIAVNDWIRDACHKRAILEPFLCVLAPYAPHIAEELWHKCAHRTSVTQQPFPELDLRYLVQNTYIYPVSVNGKVRAQMELPAEWSTDQIKAEALAQQAIQRWLAGKKPKRVIVIPQKIVNIVL